MLRAIQKLCHPNNQTRIQRSDSRLKKELVFGNGCFLLAGSRSWKNISDVAGMAGFEPTISESKSGVLPLHYIPISGQNQRGSGSLPIPDFVGWVKGLEPSTPGTTIRCSNQLSYTHHISCTRELATYSKKVARQKGLEPLAYCLEGSCSIQLSYWRACNIWLPAQKVWSG